MTALSRRVEVGSEGGGGSATVLRIEARIGEPTCCFATTGEPRCGGKFAEGEEASGEPDDAMGIGIVPAIDAA